MMVQQPWKRSYYYFLSFAKGQKKRHGNTKGLPPHRRQDYNVSKARQSKQHLRPRPPWDNTIHDLSVWKLSPAELEVKKKALRSSFHSCSPPPSVISSGQNSSSSKADDRSRPISRGGSAALRVQLAQSSDSPKSSFAKPLAKPVKSDVHSSKEEFETRDLKLSVNGASKRCSSLTRLTTGGATTRFGKENKTLQGSPDSIKVTRESSVKCRSTSVGSKTKVLTYRERKIKRSPPSRVHSSTVDASREETRLEASRSTEQHTSNTPACSITSIAVDFEDEVKKFEAERKQRLEHCGDCFITRPKIALAGKKQCDRIEEVDGSVPTCLKLPLNVMDLKSSPTGYTHHKAGFRGRVIDSSDDSVSGPFQENLRWAKGMPQSSGNHQRHHHNARTAETEGHHPADKMQPYSWDPQTQTKELSNFGDEPNTSDTRIQSSRSGRAKLAKRYIGQVQRPSPITDWKGDREEEFEDQVTHSKDIQQYMVKCHRELMKEFKDFKLSLSRQIVNLQLDVDRILANQKAASSKRIQVLPSHHRPGSEPESGTEENFLELVDENQELPAYSSLKFRQDLIKPASPSSGESYHLPSSKVESQYTEKQKKANFDSWPQEESHHSMTSHKSYAAPSQTHVFRNLQNNPIYHVQTSDKRDGSSDSDTSESSIDLTQLNYREAMGSILEQKQEADSRQGLSADELESAGVRSKGTHPQTALPGLQRKKSNGNQSEDQSPHKDSKPDTNGHARSHHMRAGRVEEQSRTTSNTEPQPGSSKVSQKDEIGMSNLLGAYTPRSRARQEDVNVALHDVAEPCYGTPRRNSPYPGEKRSSRPASRPLFAEEPGKTSWENLSTTSPTSTYSNREPLPNQQLNNNRRGGVSEPRRFTYSRQEPQNQQEPQSQQYGKAAAEEVQPTHAREESLAQHYDYDKTVSDLGRPMYSRAEPQSQPYGKAEVEQEQSVYPREGPQDQQQYGRAGVEQGRTIHAREQPQSRPHGQAAEEQGRTRIQSSVVEKQGEGEPYMLRGWASAFLEPPTEITIKTQEITLQAASPKTGYRSSGRESPTEQSATQELPERERHRENENGNQYAVRQFAGKSSKGGCAWTVSEPAGSPNNDQKGGSANGTPTSKGRQKHHYPPASNY